MTDPGNSYVGITDATRTNDFESLKYAIDIAQIPPGTFHSLTAIAIASSSFTSLSATH